MISYIEGKLIEKNDNSIIIDNNGLGYEIFVSFNTISQLPLLNESVKILTYMQVREDGIALYGFATKEEKDVFTKLISISGIGPKNAIAILSGFPLSDLIVAIVSENTKMISKIKGLGAKTAERIVLELKDKLTIIPSSENQSVIQDLTVIDDATETLIALGINKNDAYKLAKANWVEGSSIEDIITKVLKGMGR